MTTSQELRHITNNFKKLAGDYLGEEIPLCRSMEAWPKHIDYFERKYDKEFAKDPLFRADLICRVHNRVKLFLHYCNKT